MSVTAGVILLTQNAHRGHLTPLLQSEGEEVKEAVPQCSSTLLQVKVLHFSFHLIAKILDSKYTLSAKSKNTHADWTLLD